MKVICAPDSFKESLTAADAAAAMARGIRRVMPDAEMDLCPIADGGEGTVDALVAATGGWIHTTTATGPRGRPVEARWGMLGGRAAGDEPAAVIEMASASGLALLDEAERDPTLTTTFGSGQLIGAALDAGARRLILGIGGSATTDGGCGAAQALGVTFLDSDGGRIDPPIAGGMLAAIARIDLSTRDPRIDETRFTVACDVTNPLTGPDGAAHVYGPQKGATPRQIAQLDQALVHLAKLFREQLGCDVDAMPGAGAAGGMGAGMVALLGGTLQPGVAIVLEAVAFDERVQGCALCLTGEGRLDGTSLSGKACIGVAKAAARRGVPTVALAGLIGPDAERVRGVGIQQYHAISEGLTVAESIRRAAELIESKTADVIRQLGPVS